MQAMGKVLHTSIIALRDENIVLKEDAGALEETNHELYKHCLLLNQAICAKFAEVKKITPNSMEEITRKLADFAKQMKTDCCSFISASNSSSMYPKELSKYTNDGYKKPISAYSLSLR